MKHTIILAALLGLVGCEPPDPNVSAGQTRYEMGEGECGLHIKTIVIDGNEYYATSVNGGWCLCPKLPPRAENVLPSYQRPQPPSK